MYIFHIVFSILSKTIKYVSVLDGKLEHLWNAVNFSVFSDTKLVRKF